ncbi:polysaccharide pyruvyl transferase family protein [Rhodococcoides yunnanense]|uniref:polysaccharide pyruvyl transferase family protein n=1 Tax=Rhodococcoides yunnanense TaxID=278209 RepID=UPI00111500B0|nr:polysaccharide pyruvyl transferase family protein [Rhodococcus yunnanensis]
MHAALIPMLLLSLIHGFRAVRIGVGLQPKKSRWGIFIFATAALCKENIWRDAETLKWFRTGSVAPDWAFSAMPASATEPPSDEQSAPRSRIAVSFRGDGSVISDSMVIALRDVAKDLGRKLVVVVQVERDQTALRDLAQRLNCDFVGWTTQDHLTQERRVRDAYRESSLVVSDRLHALIIAVNEGCVPVGLMEHSTSKVERNFATTSFPFISADVTGWEPSRIADEIRGGLKVKRACDIAALAAEDLVRSLDQKVKNYG